MRFFYDTEFLENGKTIELISIGMITEDESECFYAVNQDAPWEAIFRNDWLRQNVMNSISHGVSLRPYTRITLTDEYAMSKTKIASLLLDFVNYSLSDGEKAEFWAYRGAYDQVTLAQLYGKLLQVPDPLPKFTMDLKQLAIMKGNPEVPKQDYDEHNALADARHNLKVFNFLMGDNGCGITEEYV